MVSHETLVELLERQLGGLECVVLFGSRADGSARPDSDIDLAVSAAMPLAPNNLAVARIVLMAETGLGVDLIDLRDFTAPSVLLREAVVNRIVLKDSTGFGFLDRVTIIMREAEDFCRRRAIIDEGVVAKLARNAAA